jgi:hypothetical protein
MLVYLGSNTALRASRSRRAVQSPQSPGGPVMSHEPWGNELNPTEVDGGVPQTVTADGTDETYFDEVRDYDLGEGD